jgi:hypothetical protein
MDFIISKHIPTQALDPKSEFWFKTVFCIIKSSNGVDAYKESFQTEDGLSVILPGFCQNTVLNQNSDLGSSACVGICFLNVLCHNISTSIATVVFKSLKMGNLNAVLTSIVVRWFFIQYWYPKVTASLKISTKMKNRGLAGSFLFTVFPDKSFIVFFNEDFNLTLLDSHIHFTAPPEQLSFEAALKRKDCQGMIICATKAQYRDLVSLQDCI